MKIPTRLSRIRKLPGQKSATVAPGENARESPVRLSQPTHIQNIHNEQVSWLSAVDSDRTAQVVDFRQVDITKAV